MYTYSRSQTVAAAIVGLMGLPGMARRIDQKSERAIMTDQPNQRQPLIESDRTLQLLKLLADDRRWRLLLELRLSDRQVGELATRTGLPQNLVSYHLGLLRQAGLVQAHRSDADARALYYGLDIAALQQVRQQITTGLHLAAFPATDRLPSVPVVFLCTGNSVRSQMAEGWLRHLSQGQVPAQSAGTHPRQVDPRAIQAMSEAGLDISQQWSKALAALAAAPPGIVVTVCDNAREACAPCLAAPVQLHWSIPSPERLLAETPDEQAVFRILRDQVRQRVEGLLALLPTLKIAPAPYLE
jgi:ArsR family transcriptional regulator